MRRIEVGLMLVILCGIISFATVARTDSELDTTRKLVQETFPNMPPVEIEPSVIPGLYEVTAGTTTFFFSNKGYMIFGELYSKTGTNISAEKRAKLEAKRLSQLPLDKALKIGNGPKIIIEFTDPDCPYCRKVNTFLDTRKDVTRYVFLYSLKNIHKQSEAKVAYILSAKDKLVAHDEVFSGKLDNKELPPVSPELSATITRNIYFAGMVGVSGTPVLFVEGKKLAGANIPLLTTLLDGRKEKSIWAVRQK